MDNTSQMSEDFRLNIRVARLLRERRESRGLSLKEVEASTHVSASQINRIENSQTQRPAFANVLRLAAFYRIPIEELLGEEPKPRDLTPDQETILVLAEAAVQVTPASMLPYLATMLKAFLDHLRASGIDSNHNHFSTAGAS